MTVCPHCGVEFDDRKRSSQANRYLWGVAYKLIAAHLGYTSEQIHDAMKDKFLAREDITTGLRIGESTTKLGPERFYEYVEQVREWSHRFLGLYIPAPQESEDVWTQDARRGRTAA